MHPAESPSLAALQHFRATAPGAAQAIEVMVWDNTPGEFPEPAGLDALYHHDTTNPGLAKAYDAALQYAELRGSPWLMLLDQDTAVTSDYLREVLAVTQKSNAAVLVPRLTLRGLTLSPFKPVFVGPPQPLPANILGEQTRSLQAFNSGAVFSVPQLRARGGFDLDFPIDYLDHATFAAVATAHGRVHVLTSSLEHELASQAPGPLSGAGLRREKDILAGERRFFRRYGTPRERRMLWLRFLRRAASVAFHKRDFRNARMILRTMVGLKP
jgi:hypothetical protein